MGEVEPLRCVVDVPLDPAAPSMARSVTAAIAHGWGMSDLVDDAELVVSELITNAYRHAPVTQSVELELIRRDGGMRIAVADGSAVRPLVRELERDRQGGGGWGLRLITALATEWGSEDHQGGKRVWVDLGRRA
jgi:anti-sigma regulatory factor (Ser/Thr protein kinase)